MHSKTLIFIALSFGYLNISESLDCSVLDHKNTELKLKHALLCDYDAEERPNSKNGTTVKIRLYIKRFDYSEDDATLTVDSWVGMKWNDDRLKWNPKDYDNLNEIVVQSEQIWMPDFAIYNSDTTQFHETCSQAPCFVNKNGTVACMVPCVHTGDCDSNFLNWPYDTQDCELHFGSWMHKGTEITFKELQTIIDGSKIKHNEWKITNITVKNNLGNYSCCPNETFPSITYSLKIDRHSEIISKLITAPVLIVSIINLAVLWLNPNCRERLVLITLSLLSHFEYLQFLSWSVPKNGETVPLALLFFKDSLIITCFLLLETLIMRGLLMCQNSSPAWIKSTAQSLRGNKVGQLMFENPYIINRTPLDNSSADTANLVEGQNQEQITADGSPLVKTTEKDVWFSAVKIIDTLLFIILLITYIAMIFGWIPTSNTNSLDGKKVEIHVDVDE